MFRAFGKPGTQRLSGSSSESRPAWASVTASAAVSGLVTLAIGIGVSGRINRRGSMSATPLAPLQRLPSANATDAVIPRTPSRRGERQVQPIGYDKHLGNLVVQGDRA